MSIIIVDVSGFPNEYPVYKFNGSTTTTIAYTTPDMVESMIPQLCFGHNVDTVKIAGPAPYVQELAAAIQANYNFNYHNKLNVEVC